MNSKDKHSGYSFLLPVGIIMLLPAFIVSFIHQGNIIDKLFFFIALLGYILIIVSATLSHGKKDI